MSRQIFGIGPAVHTRTSGTAPPTVHEVLRSPGRPLEPAVRGPMEAHFGHDFSQVRVHTDARAAESARAVAAEAYTVGRHVVFGSGAFHPSTGAGRQLLAHELTHVVQQGGGDPAGGALPVTPPGGHLETEAEQQGTAKAEAIPPSVQRRVVVSPPAAATQVAKHLETFCGASVFYSSTGELSSGRCGAVKTDEACNCVCDVVDDARRLYTINVLKSTATSTPQKLWNGSTESVPEASVFPNTDVGSDPVIELPDVGSDVEFGVFDPSGNAIPIPLWRILAHELCGHGRLMQTYLGDAGDRAGHDSTIDTENAIATPVGEPARGHYADRRQGESFFNKKKDPKVVFSLTDGLHYEVP